MGQNQGEWIKDRKSVIIVFSSDRVKLAHSKIFNLGHIIKFQRWPSLFIIDFQRSLSAFIFSFRTMYPFSFAFQFTFSVFVFLSVLQMCTCLLRSLSFSFLLHFYIILLHLSYPIYSVFHFPKWFVFLLQQI